MGFFKFGGGRKGGGFVTSGCGGLYPSFEISSAVAAATPPNTIFGSALHQWLKADAGFSPTGWIDQSGNGNNLTLGVAPVAGTDINGNASVNFDGSSQYLMGPTWTTVAPATSWTVYLVCNNHETSTEQTNTYDNRAIMADGSAAVGIMVCSGKIMAFEFLGGDNNVRVATPNGTPFRAKVMQASNVLHLAVGTGTDNTVATAGVGGGTQLMALNYSSHYARISMGEWIMVNRATTSGEDALMATYLQQRWGVL